MITTTYRSSNNQAYWPLPKVSDQSAKASLKVKLSNLASTLTAQLTASHEPRVWQSQDSAGNVQWHAYDSFSNQLIRNASETELRIWLETRHHF